MTTSLQPIDLAREAPFTLGATDVRPATREVQSGETREVLEPRVMQVLVALARQRGEVVSRDELISTCWAGRAVGDDAINRCTGRIRRLAETHGGFSLETIARVGYRLTESIEPAQAAAETRKRFWRAVPRWVFFVAGVLIVLAAGLIYRSTSPGHHVARSQQVLIVRAPGKPLIAVLPFTPLYGDPAAQRLGDSIALSVSDMLTSSIFDVVSPTKSMQFRGAAKARAVQALHADFLIDGDLQRDKGVITVAVRLIDGRDGTTIIAASLQRPVSEADSLPAETASQLAAVASISRGSDASSGWDPRVLSAYLKAIYQFSARDDIYGANETARNIARQLPNDGFAQSLHGFMAAYLAAALPPDKKAAAIAEARSAAERAIQLEPGYGDSYAVLAMTTPLYQWAIREQYLKKGLAVFPDSQNANIHLIELLQNAGRFRDAAPAADALVSRRGFQTHSLLEAINARLWGGQIDGARALIQRGRRQSPKTAWFIAKMFEATAFHNGLAQAEALLREPAVTSFYQEGGVTKTFSDILSALRHRRAPDIDTVANDCRSTDGRTSEYKRTCFMALVVLGRLDDAFRLAEILYPDQRGATPAARERRWLSNQGAAPAYLFIPLTAPLRMDPRFRDVVERIGVLQYWKASGHPPDFCASEKAPVCDLLKA